MWLKWNDNSEEFVKILRNKEILSESSIFNISYQKNWCYTHKYNIRTENEGVMQYFCQISKIIVAYTRNKSHAVEVDTKKVLKAIINGKNTLSRIEEYLFYMTKDKIMEAVSWLIFSGNINSDIDQKPIKF